MSEQERDGFPGLGGSYVIENGVLRRVEEPTQDHPEGNRPRDAEGRALDGLTGQPIDAPAAEAEKPARRRSPAAAAASGD